MSPLCARMFLHAVLTLAALSATGCSSSTPSQPAERAEKALEQFLDAWTRGEPAEKFADPNQPIQGSDPDWKAGYRLKSFLSSDAQPSQEMPDHVRCRVSLALQDARGTLYEKEVVYDVKVARPSVITRASP